MGSGCSSNSSQKAEDEEPLATQDQPSKAKTKTSNDLPHHNPPKKKPPSSKAQETRSNDIKNPNNNNRNDMNNNNSTKSGNNKSQILSEISNNKAVSVVSTDPSGGDGEDKAKGLQNDQDLNASPKPKSRPPTPFSRPVTARVAQRQSDQILPILSPDSLQILLDLVTNSLNLVTLISLEGTLSK